MKKPVKGEGLTEFESKGAGTMRSGSMNRFEQKHQSSRKPFVEHLYVQR